MRIVFIGAGNVATVLARLFKDAGHAIAGIYSASAASARRLAEELDIVKFGNIANITSNADVYILAVNDNAITEISKIIMLPGKIVVHTSGSTPQHVLRPVSSYHGVLYPLQSLRKETKQQPVIPLLVNGSDPIVKEQIRVLAESISLLVQDASDQQRLHLHLAAVMVSNFSNYLYTLANDYCNEKQVPFKALVPLIREVAERTALYNPADMQTGPAMRNDTDTIEKHLRLLSKYPVQHRIYKEITESILTFYHKG